MRRIAEQPGEVLGGATAATAAATPAGVGLVAAGRITARAAASASRRRSARCAAMTRRGVGVQLSRLPRSIEFFPIW